MGGVRVLSAAVVSLALLVPGHAAAASRSDRVDKVFTDVDTVDEPGCVVGVGDRGKVLFTRGYGTAKLDGPGLTRRSVFDIASVSKQITAAVVYMLVADGTLDLGRDIKELVPELPDYTAPVTLDEMLHHTSGLPDYTLLLEAPVTARTTTDDALKALSASHELLFVPGSRFNYSNTNYFLLSLAAERVTGTSFRKLVTRRIFRPLGMGESVVRDDAREKIERAAIGYTMEDERFERSVTGWEQTGDGAVNTTVVDLLRWAGNLSTFEVGGTALRDAMLTAGPVLDDGDGYGGGLVVHRDGGGRLVAEHSGAWAGYVADLVVLPDDGLSVAVLCNRDDVDPFDFAMRVLRIWDDRRKAS